MNDKQLIEQLINLNQNINDQVNAIDELIDINQQLINYITQQDNDNDVDDIEEIELMNGRKIRIDNKRS